MPLCRIQRLSAGSAVGHRQWRVDTFTHTSLAARSRSPEMPGPATSKEPMGQHTPFQISAIPDQLGHLSSANMIRRASLGHAAISSSRYS